MPHFGHDLPQRLFAVVQSAVGVFLLVVVFYIVQYVSDMDFVCSCKQGVHLNCYLYMGVPPVILTWVVGVTEPLHQRRIFSLSLRNKICNSFIKYLFTYLILLAIWAATVMFDGDWYFCLKTNLDASQTGLPCKKNLTYEEHLIQASYWTDSLDIGFGIIFCLIFVWTVVEFLIDFCIRGKTRTITFKLCRPFYRVHYEDLLEEQVSCHLKDELTEIAKKRAKAICKPYLQAIEDNEQYRRDRNDVVNSTASEIWQEISASDFWLSGTLED